VSFANKDVYLNVAGGLRINEPAADLAVAAAIASSAFDVPLPKDSVVFGEISLSGDVRPVGRTEARLKEASKLGFQTAITSNIPKKLEKNLTSIMPIVTIKALPDLISRVEISAERGLEDDSAWGMGIKAA
jgi:DNA repair protein RadA/Sms